MLDLVADLLPQAAHWAEAGVDDLEEAEATLTPGERRAIASAVSSRQREFALGRLCARRALLHFGVCAEILVGSRREPLWPEGFVGAITHQDDIAMAAVAKESDLAGLGIDLARHASLPEGVLDQVASASERAWIGVDSSLNWDAILFSTKESLYKAISTTVGRVVDFDEATLERAGAALVVDGTVAGVPGDRLTLRYAVRDRWVITTATFHRR